MAARPYVWLVLAAACGSAPKKSAAPMKAVTGVEDPDGPHRASVAALVQPLIDHQIVSSAVVGLYDAGKLEIYGFGQGPNHAPPNGHTLYELGSVTKVYTSLLLADSVQRREVEMDTPVSELLPPGVTMPTRDHVSITLKDLALHTSGLPRMPPSVRPDSPDPYGNYGEDNLYADLLHTELEHAPGEIVAYSNYGVGVLGFVLGRKLGTGFAKALDTRILEPLGLHDTFLTVPATAQARLAPGTTDDLKPAPRWTLGALAGTASLVSSVHDQLQLVDDELDAASGSKAPLRGAMRLSQEEQLQNVPQNEGIGWQIDNEGRYWHNGTTGGYHAFVGFDPKARRGVVILASTGVSVVDRLSEDLYRLLAGDAVKPQEFPAESQIAKYVGTYDFAGHKLTVTPRDKRLYIEGEGTGVRLVPMSDHEFWIESLQSLAVFQRDGEDIRGILFVIGDHTIMAPRVPAAATGTAPATGSPSSTATKPAHTP